MRMTILIGALILICGCSTVKTEIIEPDGSVYIIKSKDDAIVTMKFKDREYTVDNRGNQNIFQSLTEWLLIQTPEIIQAE
jgi:hypothetical protein